MKKCSKCQIEKDETEFHRDEHRPDHLTSQCAKCRNTTFKKTRENNKNRTNIEIPTQKFCPRCEQMKKSDEFFRYKGSKDRLQTYCKKCLKAKVDKKKMCEYVSKHRNKVKEQPKKPILEYCCSKCGITKPIENFNQDKYTITGYTYQCKECRNKKGREYHSSKIGLEKARIRDRKELENPCKRLARNVSRAILAALTENASSKDGSSVWEFLPYTSSQLKKHLENLWEPWMNWDNYGPISLNKQTWQVDHILPQSYLQYDTMEHPNFLKCWSLENLRPLDAFENVSKKDSFPSWLIDNENGIEEFVSYGNT